MVSGICASKRFPRLALRRGKPDWTMKRAVLGRAELTVSDLSLGSSALDGVSGLGSGGLHYYSTSKHKTGSGMKKRPEHETKAQIREAAIDLLILNGYRGTNFRLIAERLGITTTNIHYHFGGKPSLVLDVVTGYVADAIRRQESVWRHPDTTLREKLKLASTLNRQRYLRYNQGENTNRPWSLIWRLRMEKEALTPDTIACLDSYTTSLNQMIREAVLKAGESGELGESAPLGNITTLLISLVDSAAAVALNSGWHQLDELYTATADIVFSAYRPNGPF